MWRDSQFWAALAAAPCCWLLLLLIGEIRPDWRWPFYYPMRFALAVIIYPLLEEIVFRGLVQEWFHRWFKQLILGPLSLANLLTSLSFTAVHFLYHPPLWAMAVIAPSLVFGYFKDKYGSLVSPVVLHIFYNGGYYWLLQSPRSYG